MYLGTRYTNNGGQLAVTVDGGPAATVPLAKALEDVMVRVPLGQFSGGAHTVIAQHTGAAGTDVYFDFLEIAYPTGNLPAFPAVPATTLATDWDTDAVEFGLAPERAAWLMDTLGFGGRANHYAGALWFYELFNPGLVYASATVTFGGTPEFGKTTTITLGGTPISHLNLWTDTAASIAQCFALLIAAGSSAVWARADGATLTITARAVGTSGNGLALKADAGGSTKLTTTVSGDLAGGEDGAWLTDLNATPRINRACRDWTSSFVAALKGYGITPTVSFSMELGNGDDSTAAGIAQRYPDGTACHVSTPALQTNFSPASTAFWQQIYADMAAVMSAAGVTPYLQFGEVQWWYFAGTSGMPFYDAFTTAAFQAQYGRPMQTITNPNADPAQYPQECVFLQGLIGQFCAAVAAYVLQSEPDARFEVLYPADTNDTALMETVNFAAAEWTAANLACLKTENFGFTAARNLDEAAAAIALPAAKGFPPAQTSHLVGIGDYTTPWAEGMGVGHRGGSGIGGAVRAGPVLPDRVWAAVTERNGTGAVYGEGVRMPVGMPAWQAGRLALRGCGGFGFGQGLIGTGDHYQEHGEDFRIAKVILEETFGESGEDDGYAAVEQIAGVGAAGRQNAKATPEIVQHLAEHPHQNQHYGDTALGGILQINIVEMTIPAFGKRARDVGRNPFLEMVAGAFGAETEQGVGFDHAQAGAPGDHAKGIGVDGLRVKDRREAVVDDGRGEEVSGYQEHGAGEDQPAAVAPEQIERGERQADPDGTGLGQQYGEGHEHGAGEPDPGAVALGRASGRRIASPARSKEQECADHDDGEHLLRGEGIPVAHEAGDALGNIERVIVLVELMGLSDLLYELDQAADAGDAAKSGPSEKEPADEAEIADRGIDHQQLSKDVELADLRQAFGGMAGKSEREEGSENE